MKRSELFENLVLMALADGSVSRSEFELLSDRCQIWGITSEQFQNAINRAIEPGAQFHLPEDRMARFSLLKEMVRMMGADGMLADNERRLFAAAAATMEISGAEVDQIIDMVVKK